MKPNWQTHAEAALDSKCTKLTPISGGDFAESHKATLQDNRTVFIKTHTNPPRHFFTTEATGLTWLGNTQTVNIPTVLAVNESPAYLALEWIDTGSGSITTEETLGHELAALHASSVEHFGRVDHKTTGSLALPNKPLETWSEFFATQRILPLCRIARDRQSLPDTTIDKLDTLAHRLDTLDVPVEPPSLLHGDLWGGNRLVDRQGKSWLIDPAAHHGHREFDLAMMQLFGGYDSRCFAAYDEVYPLAPDWQQRIALHQLAPLVVHAIKFGGSYAAATTNAVQRYS